MPARAGGPGGDERDVEPAVRHGRGERQFDRGLQEGPVHHVGRAERVAGGGGYVAVAAAPVPRLPDALEDVHGGVAVARGGAVQRVLHEHEPVDVEAAGRRLAEAGDVTVVGHDAERRVGRVGDGAAGADGDQRGSGQAQQRLRVGARGAGGRGLRGFGQRQRLPADPLAGHAHLAAGRTDVVVEGVHGLAGLAGEQHDVALDGDGHGVEQGDAVAVGRRPGQLDDGGISAHLHSSLSADGDIFVTLRDQ